MTAGYLKLFSGNLCRHSDRDFFYEKFWALSVKKFYRKDEEHEQTKESVTSDSTGDWNNNAVYSGIYCTT